MYRNINSEPLLKCYQLQQVIQMNHRGKHWLSGASFGTLGGLQLPSRMKTDSMSLKHFMLGTEGSLKKRYASGSERVLYEASQAAATEGTAYGCELNGHYSNSLRERFIRRLIVNGKKSIATKIFDESLELLKKRIEEVNSGNYGSNTTSEKQNLHSLSTLTKDEIFTIALRKAQPWITTSSLRRGGKKVIIPEILTPAQQESIAIRWLILNSRSTSGKPMSECLSNELFGCLTNQGKTINQREQLHKLAEANRAWAN